MNRQTFITAKIPKRKYKYSFENSKEIIKYLKDNIDDNDCVIIVRNSQSSTCDPMHMIAWSIGIKSRRNDKEYGRLFTVSSLIAGNTAFKIKEDFLDLILNNLKQNSIYDQELVAGVLLAPTKLGFGK